MLTEKLEPLWERLQAFGVDVGEETVEDLIQFGDKLISSEMPNDEEILQHVTGTNNVSEDSTDSESIIGIAQPGYNDIQNALSTLSVALEMGENTETRISKLHDIKKYLEQHYQKKQTINEKKDKKVSFSEYVHSFNVL